MRLRSVITVIIGVGFLAVVGLSVTYQAVNPEHLDLDPIARRQAPGRFVKLSDGVTHYQIAGPDSGQRVILVHGFSTPSYIWDSTAIGLATAGFRVARYDHFGRGFSDRPDVAYNAELYDRQLSQLLDSLGWRQPVDVVGLSMGGPVTAWFAGHHPDRVRSLTLVDPAAGEATGLPLMMRLPLLGPLLWQIRVVPGMAAAQLGDFFEPAKWPDWPDRYRVQMRYHGFGRALRSTLLSEASLSLDSVYSRVGKLSIPVLLIWGKADSSVSIKYADSVRAEIPQAQFVPIDRAGHLPHMERTDVVNPLLIRFLRGGRDSATPDSAR